jgi:hypothetical protein
MAIEIWQNNALHFIQLSLKAIPSEETIYIAEKIKVLLKIILS